MVIETRFVRSVVVVTEREREETRERDDIKRKVEAKVEREV